VIVDHDNRRVMEVLENRDKATVLAYLKQARAEGLLAQVTEVTTDMWDGYVEAAKEAFGSDVIVTIDRFHVMKNLQECLTRARRELQRKLTPVERDELKGSRWLWQTNWENLDAEQQRQLTTLKERFPELGALADKRESLRALFEDRTIQTPSVGRERLQAWLKEVQELGLAALNRFATTLTNWMDKIANYFQNRGNNGRTEGFNRGLRTILWRTCGMTNFRHFRLRVLHCFGLATK
jgi:transposase